VGVNPMTVSDLLTFFQKSPPQQKKKGKKKGKKYPSHRKSKTNTNEKAKMKRK
jgi:hypothetical protein